MVEIKELFDILFNEFHCPSLLSIVVIISPPLSANIYKALSDYSGDSKAAQLSIIYQISPADIRHQSTASPGGRRQQYHGVTFSSPLPPPASRAETQFLTPRRKYLRRRENPPTQPGHYQIRFRNKVEDRWVSRIVIKYN